jgi:hypothetical protein
VEPRRAPNLGEHDEDVRRPATTAKEAT